MLKRNVTILTLIVLFAVSVTAFAFVPASPVSLVSGEQVIASLRFFDGGEPVLPPECPTPDLPGCG